MLRRRPVTSIVLFIFAASLTVFATQSSDVLMYLVLARDFVFGAHRGDVDPYLYARSAATLTWTHEWLSYVIYFGAWQIGHWAGLIGVKIAVLLATFALVLRDPREDEAPGALWAGLWIVGMTAASFRFVERSSAFTDLALVLLARWLLVESRVTRALAIRLTLLFLVWAQLHPGYPLGFALLGTWVVYRRAWSPALLAVVLAPLINPDGARGYLYPFAFMFREGRAFQKYNFEWFATYHPAFRFAPESLAYWTFAFVAVALIVRARSPRDLRAAWAGGALILGVAAVRFVPTAVYLTLICLRPWSRLDYLRIPRWVAGVGLTLLTALAFKNFTRGYESSSGPREPRWSFDRRHFASGNLEILRQHSLPGRLYASHDFGAQLLWEKMGPVFRHGFVTDVEFYENEVVAAFRSGPEFARLAAKYDWSMLLVEKQNAYRSFWAFLKDQTEWKIVGEDDASYLIYRLPGDR